MPLHDRDYDCNYGCPVEATLDVIGGRWKGVLLFHLSGGTRRFGELRRATPGVTQRMLTLQLRELEADGLVRREVFAEAPPRVEYSLTEFGRTLIPVIRQMHDWGITYLERIEATRAAGRAEGLDGTDPGERRVDARSSHRERTTRHSMGPRIVGNEWPGSPPAEAATNLGEAGRAGSAPAP
jgi:DNA-binding HxlR family transcriptional regulator